MPSIHLDTRSPVSMMSPVDAPSVHMADWEGQSTTTKTIAAASQLSAPDVNYMAELRKLVAELLIQLKETSQTDRKHVRELDERYRALTLEGADKTRALGSHEFKAAMVTFAASFVQLALKVDTHREIAKIFASEVCPKVAEIFGSSIKADSYKVNNLSQLVLQQYIAEVGKKQSEGQSKQDLLATLREALEGLKAVK